MKKIFIIGDSFCTKGNFIKNRDWEMKEFWGDVLNKNLLEFEVELNGDSSRDIQTIIEDWIRIIKHIKKEDFLIICLPYFRRTRLPLEKNYYKKTQIDGNILNDRFIGTPSYSKDFHYLEIWGNDYEWRYHQDKLSHQEIINTSIANQETTIEVIESLIELTKGFVYVFSWDDMDIKSKFIEDKNIIKNNIGLWETHQDVYYETKGECGQIGDLHWSYTMHKLFGEYLLSKFFQNEKKSFNNV